MKFDDEDLWFVIHFIEWEPFDYFQKSILEELLLILDPAEQYGANFLICLNGESKYVYLQIEEDKNMQLVDDYEAIPYQYIPPVAKKWNNLESDLEIQKLLVTDTRPKVSLFLLKV